MSGLLTVFTKELSDHFSSWRFLILFILILMVGALVSVLAAHNIRDTVADPRFVFLGLYTYSSGSQTSQFLYWMTILIPIVGIALGFDAVNGEKNSGTMSRLVSQPIYRDTIINGKFMAGVVTLAIVMASIVLLVAGFGMRVIGLPPTSEEAARLMFFVIVSVVYGSFWLALSILFSVLFRRVAISALASMVLWVFFAFFFTLIASSIANSVAPAGSTFDTAVKNAQANMNILRFSPVSLFQQAMVVLLVPSAGIVQQLVQMGGAAGTDYLLTNPLSLGQSLLVVWPQLMTIIMLTIICFAISYIRFMREEIRAS